MIIENIEKRYSYIIAILILTLFVNIRYQTGFALIRLFDFLCIILAFYFFVKEKKFLIKNDGLKILIPFFLIHIILSYKLGLNNFLRELLQCFIIFSFLYILLKTNNRFSLKIFLKYFLFLTMLLIIYVICYHIYNGRFVGWKLLPDARIAYSIFTICFFIYFKMYNKNNLKFLLYAALLLLILLLSGERKAIAIFIIFFSLNYLKGFGVKSLLVLFLIYISFTFSVNHIKNSYIKDKVVTSLNFMNTGNFNYVIDSGKISEGDTWSNVQRAFSFEISKELIAENPIIGIGTNNYINFIDENYYFLPEQLREGIHGEFLRIIVENGLLGLIFYLLIWSTAWRRFKHKLSQLVDLKILTRDQSRFYLFSIFISILFYVATEASSTRTFIMIGLISILPDLISSFIDKNKKKEIIEK